MAKILLVEDDLALSREIIQWLKQEQHQLEHAADGKLALDLMRFYAFDLIILDWMLPGMSGVAICREFRHLGGNTPVLMLTGRAAVEDKEAGFDAGADDYLPKPFHFKELSARIRALLRRPAHFSGHKLVVGDLLLDTQTHTLRRRGQDVHLFPKEFSLLELFMKHPDEVFTTEALLDRVWPSDSDATADTLRTYIKTLRAKISPEDKQAVIKTVHHLGYKLASSSKDPN